MNYVRCIKNQTLYEDDLAETYEPFLVVGQVYKIAPPHANDGENELRIIDGEGEDYLYPASYFEPFLPNGDEKTQSITVHLDPYLKGVLHAEAVAAKKPVGALVRDWLDERLDLPQRYKRPSVTLQAAMDELERGEGERFDNVEDLFKALEAD